MAILDWLTIICNKDDDDVNRVGRIKAIVRCTQWWHLQSACLLSICSYHRRNWMFVIAALIIVLNNLRINSFCCLCDPSFYALTVDRGWEQKCYLLGVLMFFFLQIDQRTNGFVMMFRKDSIVDPPSAPHGGLWSIVTSGRCPLPLAWRNFVFVWPWEI